MNRVCLTGRLTRDPELRELSSGQDVVKIRIAVDNGRDREPTFRGLRSVCTDLAFALPPFHSHEIEAEACPGPVPIAEGA